MNNILNRNIRITREGRVCGGGIATFMPAENSFGTHAEEYLVRRLKEPLDVYQERLARVFYENYVGSIVDWYTATLMREEPVIDLDGRNAVRGISSPVHAELRPARDHLDAVFPATADGSAGLRQIVCGGRFSEGWRDEARSRAEEDAQGRAGLTW